MAIYKFKVTIDEDEDVTRDIEIRSNQGFYTLHKAIVEYFNFRPAQVAEYYSSDQQWYEGDKIIEITGESKDTRRLADYIIDPHQRFICMTESYNDVALMVELIRVSKEADGIDYPICVDKQGFPPHYTQPPLAHIADEEGDAPQDEMMDLEDGPSDTDLAAAEKEAEGVEFEMPDFSEFLKEVEKDAAADTQPEPEEEKTEKTDSSSFDINDL